jgi:hypothetical protein
VSASKLRLNSECQPGIEKKPVVAAGVVADRTNHKDFIAGTASGGLALDMGYIVVRPVFRRSPADRLSLEI